MANLGSEHAAQSLVLVIHVLYGGWRIYILRQSQYLRQLSGKVATPDTGHVLGSIANGLREKGFQTAQGSIETLFGGTAANRADEGADARIRQAHFEFIATAKYGVREKSRGMHYFFWEVDGEVANDTWLFIFWYFGAHCQVVTML
jgi:hypothetical protein